MSAPKLLKQDRVAVADIDTEGRLRPVSDAGVESLIASVKETGVMKDAIHVRKMKDGSFRLMAGGHRVEMARRLGWDDIEAKVWSGVTDDWAKLMEIDDNLAGAEMNALDTAVFLAERKRVYEKLHPETKADAFKGNQHTGNVVSDMMSFTTSTAEKFGLSKRQVERIVAAGAKLGPKEIAELRSAPRPVSLSDLTEISKIGDTDERVQVVLSLAGGNAKNAAEARRQMKVRPGDVARSDADQKHIKLMDAFARAPLAARRAFVAAHAEPLRKLLAEVDAKADAPDAVPFVRGKAKS